MVKNNDNQDITEFTIINKMQKHLKELNQLRLQLSECIEEPTRFYSNNIDKRILKIVAEKYNFIDIIEVNGELYKVEKRRGIRGENLICRRILWDLTLSENQFEIERVDEEDSDGEYDYTHHEIIEEILDLDKNGE